MQPDVSRETSEKLLRFEGIVREESGRQNLVSRSTLDDFKVRHVADALQLINLASAGGTWCDIGSGAGLPGLVVAIVNGKPMTLIEPRRLRADFLRRAVSALDLPHVEVIEAKAERAAGSFDVITARAVASLDALFAMSAHLAHHGTRWLLPKGRGAKKELEAARQSWQGRFALVPSMTSADAMIVIAEQVAPRSGK